MTSILCGLRYRELCRRTGGRWVWYSLWLHMRMFDFWRETRSHLLVGWSHPCRRILKQLEKENRSLRTRSESVFLVAAREVGRAL